ncbi:MAG: porin [Rickettsiales bacterium]|jgi:hypothetical protein|nr:porin [Rickettsiales bacterium]
MLKNKKSVILATVTLALSVSVVKADESVKIGGRIKSGYTYSKKSNEVAKGVYGDPVNFKLNFTKPFDENISGYVGFNTTGNNNGSGGKTYAAGLEEAFLTYKTNVGTFKVGKFFNALTVAGFGSSNSGSLNGVVNNFSPFDSYFAGVGYTYNNDGLGINAAVFDNNTYSLTLGYVTNSGFNIRGAIAYSDDVKGLNPGGDSKYLGVSDKNNKDSDIKTYSADFSYTPRGIYAGVATTINDTKKENGSDKLPKTVVYSATFLYAIGGDFDNAANLKTKQNNAFYFGGFYNQTEEFSKTDVKQISGVVGYAPRNDVRIVLQYDNIKNKPNTGNSTATNQVGAQARVFF